MNTKITRIGNSRGIVLPAAILKSLALEEGDEVQIHFDEQTQVFSLTFPKSKQLKLTIH